jgi:hypothetical protein
MSKPLLTKKQYNQLVKNNKEQDGSKDFKVVAKLFNPTGIGTWYLSELNPETNVAFGLADLHEKEFGYISLDELKEFKGTFGLGIERDKLFTGGRIMQNNEGLFKPFSCESYEMSSGGYIKVKKETPSTCWKLYAKELLQTAYESPSHYQVNIRKDFKGIKPTTIKKMEAA